MSTLRLDENAIHQNLHTVANRFGNGWQRERRRADIVELPAPVIGHDDTVGAGIHGALGIVDVENSLEHQLARPMPADPREIIPGDGGIKLAIDPIFEIRRIAGAGYRGLEISEGQRFAAQGPVMQNKVATQRGCERMSQARTSFFDREIGTVMPFRVSR